MILGSECFDGLHYGHVWYLQQSSLLRGRDEQFVVAIATDDYIRRRKGREPHWPERDRLQTVWALRCVDNVLLDPDEGTAHVIRKLRPRIFVKGPDWRDRLPAEVTMACADVGALIRFTETEHAHTSQVRA